MRRVKLVLTLVVVVVVLIVVFQNTAAVQTQVLFWHPEPPLVVLMLATLLVGFVAGLIVARKFSRAREKKEDAGKEQAAKEPVEKEQPEEKQVEKDQGEAKE